jgi:deazaflavin-dependent oxidoreductase (nitroreductase family)
MIGMVRRLRSVESVLTETHAEVTVPTDEEFLAYNQGIIGEFRANGGVVTQLPFPVLLLTTTGARSGKQTTTPLGFGAEGGRVYVVASRGGTPVNPAWFYNLRANPTVTVELGGESYQARAVITEGAERDRLYGLISAEVAALAEYETNTDRKFPVVVLEGVPAPA